jgi:hypothetical protein
MTALVPQGVSIPVVRPLEYLESQFGWVDLGASKEANGGNGGLHLWCKLVPKLDGKVHIGSAEGAGESIL